jgi:hypothetical protein
MLGTSPRSQAIVIAIRIRYSNLIVEYVEAGVWNLIVTQLEQ